MNPLPMQQNSIYPGLFWRYFTPYFIGKLKERDTISMTKNVNDNNFEGEVLKAEGPVMVDFWAEWCGPCKAMSPLVDELTGEMGDRLKIVKVNIDESPEAPAKFGVRGIPTFMIFKGGQVIDTRVSGMSKTQLTEWVESSL